MAASRFWTGMQKRVGLKLTDKLMVGNVDDITAEYIDIADIIALLNTSAGAPLRKDGYRWIKGDGNSNLTTYEIGDEFIGVGTLYPGFLVHGYIKAEPTATPDDYITLLSAVKN